MSILVTGGRGAVARSLTTFLAGRGLPYRLASRAPDTPEAVRCDLADPTTFAGALAGIRAVFLYAEATGIEAFVEEAGAAGVEHVVLLSSSAVITEDATVNPLAASHLAVEEALLASSLHTTLLRPGAFAGNARGWSSALSSGRPVRLPHPGAHSAPIHEADIAETALTLLTDPARGGGAHTLTGPQSLTFATQLEILGSALGRTLPYEEVTPGQWKADVAEYLPAPYADALLGYWAAADGVPTSTTDTVERFTGHPARSFATWAQENASDFRRP
ncbi:SDR family oxidoreductase [Streptomyces sp. NPDC001568]|uniref:SDR family oxidoreductase n=1 Tax=Streptomyces sp. NPDC001568 TaxID=3364588 RepID=UPI003675DE79